MKESGRNISIDLLKIICMLMIVTLHLFSYSNINEQIHRFSGMFWTKEILTIVSGVCVNCFVLISGYYGMKSTFRVKKILTLLSETFFYSICLYMILVLFRLVEWDNKTFLFSLFPTTTRQYWFITTYIGMYLLSPLLKKIGENLTKHEYIVMLLSGFMLFVVYYNLFFFCDNLNFGGATGVVWFSYLYLCGMYLYRFQKQRKNNSKNIMRYIILIVLNLASRMVFYFLHMLTGKEIFFTGASIFGSVYNSIFVFLESVAFFCIFSNWHIKELNKKCMKIVSTMSVTSFAVYLIHDNNLIRIVLWDNLNYSWVDSIIKLLLSWFGTTVSIYIICTGIETIRLKIDKYIQKNTNIYEKITAQILKYSKLLLEKVEERVDV